MNLIINNVAFTLPNFKLMRQQLFKRVASELSTAEADEPAKPTKQIALLSKKIEDMNKKIEDLKTDIESVKSEHEIEKESLVGNEEEYGDEVARIKKEFSRMKERAIEESSEALAKAKVDAVKEVLPVADNYGRAKSLFDPIETDTEKAILETYDSVFETFQNVLNSFGLEKVEAVGQPFDFNFMEAIMAQPSMDYDKDLVCMEYQVGYKIGEKSVRPSMVVVSQGPGPSGNS